MGSGWKIVAGVFLGGKLKCGSSKCAAQIQKYSVHFKYIQHCNNAMLSCWPATGTLQTHSRGVEYPTYIYKYNYIYICTYKHSCAMFSYISLVYSKVAKKVFTLQNIQNLWVAAKGRQFQKGDKI